MGDHSKGPYQMESLTPYSLFSLGDTELLSQLADHTRQWARDRSVLKRDAWIQVFSFCCHKEAGRQGRDW